MRLNQEQSQAAYHNGGVLLSAGAGAGKTTVLIEHLLYKIKGILNEFKENENLEKILSEKLEKIVLMTFTNKAAGEIGLRLRRKIKEKVDSEKKDKKNWSLVFQLLDKITIKTIHGFCLKILQLGIVEEIGFDISLISESEFISRIERLYQEWIETYSGPDLDMLIHYEQDIKKSLIKIFLDPLLREEWLQTQPNAELDWDQWLSELVDIKGWNLLFSFKQNSLDQAYCDKSWFKLLQSFLEKRKESFRDLDLLNFFESIARWPSLSKKLEVSVETREVYTLLKEFRDFLKIHSEALRAFQENREKVLSWSYALYSVCNFIESRYLDEKGLTFADLEYYVAKALKKKSVQQQVAKYFDYLIVDEFQDTSSVQYSIIKSVLRDNLNQLFCVGDVKQAIYGFRGGELGVFIKCSQEMKQHLSLKNNYRSQKEIVNFNNEFFSNLFQKSFSFLGKDSHTIEFLAQESGRTDEIVGRIEKKLILQPDEITKITSRDKDFLESLGILELINELKSSNEVIALLYKNLTPLRDLIPLLMKQKISFVSQVKIPFLEDPIIGVFYSLLERSLGQSPEQSHEFATLSLQGYFHILGINDYGQDFLGQQILDFSKNVQTLGLYASFQRMLLILSLINPQHQKNLLLLKNLCEKGLGQVEKVWRELQKLRDEKYSTEFYAGSGKPQLIIMTAHASKGLEFDHVILGGMQTNGRSYPDSAQVGRLPGSFKWRSSLAKKHKYLTPYFILENELMKYRDFSESKRLFYVAGTRAKKGLYWCDLEHAEKATNSWIWGLRSWEKEKGNQGFVVESQSHLWRNNPSLVPAERKNLPFFHYHNLGLAQKEPFSSSQQYVFVPELSVTRLLSLSDCSRKFYLQNICRLAADQLDFLELPQSIDRPEKVGISSATRGTLLHSVLSQGIERNLVLPRRNPLDTKDKSVLQWVLDELKNYSENFNFISEQELKFPFFGFMTTGVPDLALMPKKSDDLLQLWDFKSGVLHQDILPQYWLQLKLYAYAYYVLKRYPQERSCQLTLAFLDENQLLHQKVEFSDLKEELYRLWQKTSRYYDKNLTHCSSCEYGNICHFKDE